MTLLLYVILFLLFANCFSLIIYTAMNYRELIRNGFLELLNSGIDERIAKQDAEDLLLYSLKLSKNELLKIYNKDVNDREKNIYNKYIQERNTRKPFAYITHDANFFGYNFFVNEATLIPRIDSEFLVENAINSFLKDKNIIEKIKDKKKIKILDACCGSGCLGISFVKKITEKKIDQLIYEVELTLMDVSNSAMQVAKFNAKTLLCDEKIIINYLINNILINGFGNEKYDIIMCNPPYIKSEEIKNLDVSVKNFEPHLALDGGEDGLKFYKTISSTLHKNFSQDCIAFFEIGYNQGNDVKNIFSNMGFKVSIMKDYCNNDRCVVLR